MNQRVKAVFRHGVFELKDPCDLPEDLEVDLIIETPRLEGPRVQDPAERARLRAEIVESMRRNPFPADRPQWTRDELHARR